MLVESVMQLFTSIIAIFTSSEVTMQILTNGWPLLRLATMHSAAHQLEEMVDLYNSHLIGR